MVERGRRRSLSQVLRLVHLHGSLSRAAITEASGLNRSTVSDLVAELVRLELVRESDPVATNRAGRPSPTVEPDPGVVALAVNPEIDAITTAWVGLGARVTAHRRHELDAIPTPETLVEIVRNELAMTDARVAGVGVAVPGLVRTGDGMVRWAPHLGWTEAPIRRMLAAVTRAPITVGNDATLGAVAELLFGAGRGTDDLVYLNGGASGIGGAIVASGALVGGHRGYAGEFGQIRPPADGDATANGPLEDEVSHTRTLQLLGADPLSDDELERVIRSSTDPELRTELDRQTRVLGTALGGIVSALNPAAVVLGGYLATLLRRDPGLLNSVIDRTALRYSAEALAVLPAELGDDRLLVGAAEAVFASLLDDPAAANLAGSTP